MVGDYSVEFFLELHDFLCLNLDVGCLSLHSAQRLVYHHAAVGQSGTLAFGS